MYETLRDRRAGKTASKAGGVAAVGVAKKMVLNPYDRGEMFGKKNLNLILGPAIWFHGHEPRKVEGCPLPYKWLFSSVVNVLNVLS